MPEHLFIVEDHFDVSHWLKDIATETFGQMPVQQAFDIQQAKAWLLEADARPDLVLLDLSLPDGDGLELVPLIRRINPDSCVIVTTIFDDNHHLFEALHCGVDGYLLKSESGEELGHQLSLICNDQPPLSSVIARKILHHFAKSRADDTLSPREQDVLRCIGSGMTIKQTAKKLDISPHTVSDHVKHIYLKLGISSRAEAAQAAVKFNLF